MILFSTHNSLLIKFTIVNLFILSIILAYYHIFPKLKSNAQQLVGWSTVGIVVFLLRIGKITTLLAVLVYFLVPRDSILFSFFIKAIQIIIIFFISLLLWAALAVIRKKYRKSRSK